MAAGIRIINNVGTVLIDNNYSNLALRQKGTEVVPGGGPSAPFVAITNGVDSPCIAILSDRPAVVRNINNASSPRFALRGRDGPVSTNVEYFIFDKPLQSMAVGSVGIVVKTAAGVVCFDSRLKYARVVDVFGGPALADWVGTRTYAAGRKYAVAQLQTARRITSQNLGGGSFEVTWTNSMSQVVDNVVTTTMTDYQTKPASAARTESNLGATFAVIDVTGY